MDELPTPKLEKLAQKWSGRKAALEPVPDAPHLIDIEREPTGEKVGN